MSSFSLVQDATSIGHYTGSPSTAFSSDVLFGDIIIVFWINGDAGIPDATGVTDTQGNTYLLYSQSAGYQHNFSQGVTQLWMALNVKGGPITISMQGVTNHTDNSQAMIIAEFDTAGNAVQAYGTEVDTSGNGSVNVTGLGNGGVTNSPGIQNLAFNVSGSTGSSDAMVALMLMNQFKDLFVVAGYWAEFGSDQREFPWTFTNPTPSGGTLVNSVSQPTPTWGAGAMAFQDFPYLSGNLTIDCNNPPNGTVGVAYDLFLDAYGGTPPYTFTIVGGALPPGLSLNSSTGEISGTPTTAGKYNFTVQLEDNVGTIVTATCSIAICPASGGGNFAYYARC